MSFLTLQILKTGASWSEVFTLPAIEVHKDWREAPLARPVRAFLARTPERLFFGCTIDVLPVYDASIAQGEFRAELWKQDVVELFLGSAEGGEYQELNLSPSGAWWTAVFTGYRVPLQSTIVPAGVKTFATVDKDGWSAALSIPLASLQFPLTDKTTANICGISWEKKEFWSAGEATEGEPDFHRKELRRPLLPAVSH